MGGTRGSAALQPFPVTSPLSLHSLPLFPPIPTSLLIAFITPSPSKGTFSPSGVYDRRTLGLIFTVQVVPAMITSK